MESSLERMIQHKIEFYNKQLARYKTEAAERTDFGKGLSMGQEMVTEDFIRELEYFKQLAQIERGRKNYA